MQAHGYAVSVNTLEQLEALVTWYQRYPDCTVTRIYIDGDLAVFQTDYVLPLCRKLREKSTLLLSLPYVLREEDEPYLEQLYGMIKDGLFEGFLIRSLDGLGYLRSKSGKELRRADANVYTWNHAACEQLEDFNLINGFCIPYE